MMQISSETLRFIEENIRADVRSLALQAKKYPQVDMAMAVVQVNMCCENGHKWSEFYTLNYSGFWFMGKHYDSLGCEKAKEVNSSDSEVSS